ncbi:MAG: SusC/RagA family TonB-linked outer membrane protein, partial [Marinilabiliaceae bacterium]|nr:SusC/RagA family TonB-linked outer membrane protein [Marinilabiliaceae bacterium]
IETNKNKRFKQNSNPLAKKVNVCGIGGIADNDQIRHRKNWNVNGAFTWEIIDNLSLKTDFGLDDYHLNDNRFYGKTTYYAREKVGEFVGLPAVVEANQFRKKIRNTNTINYDFKNVLRADHNMNVLIGEERVVSESSKTNSEVWGLPDFFDAEKAFNFQGSGNASVIDHFYNPDDKLLSFFGRLNYDYKSRYSLAATFRADGSSKFSDGNKWGYFPSVAVAWRLSEEDYFSADWLDNLKLRFSYGTAGNNNIPSGQMSKTFSASSTTNLNTSSTYWSSGNVLDNPDLRWETTYTRNLGLDFAVFRSKLSGSVELYRNNTTDLLFEVDIAGSGYNTQYRNMGETRNQGLEVVLNYVALQGKDYGLSFNFNIGFNQNEIISMGVLENYGEASDWASTEINYDYWISKGGSVGDMYGYRTLGRYEVSDFEGYDEATSTWILKEGVPNTSTAILGHNVRPGDLKLKDLDGENGVTVDDREIIGSANPLHTGGFSINGNYKGFDLAANFNWVYGNSIYNANKVEFTSARKYSYRNMSTIMASGNRWSNLLPDGTICNDPEQLAQMNENTSMWSPDLEYAVFHDWAVEDGSFLRLSTLSLGYTLPKQLVERIKIDRLRFYVTGYNIFCLTNYSGYDPEVDARRKTPLTPNVDYSAYPKSRQVVFGVNLNF